MYGQITFIDSSGTHCEALHVSRRDKCMLTAPPTGCDIPPNRNLIFRYTSRAARNYLNLLPTPMTKISIYAKFHGRIQTCTTRLKKTHFISYSSMFPPKGSSPRMQDGAIKLSFVLLLLPLLTRTQESSKLYSYMSVLCRECNAFLFPH